ncbi:tetratricopeptide repeat protein [Hyphomonas adhaerens]|nr:tetratricopeptide repeat protein [Hyphomonas adhaerens]
MTAASRVNRILATGFMTTNLAVPPAICHPFLPIKPASCIFFYTDCFRPLAKRRPHNKVSYMMNGVGLFQEAITLVASDRGGNALLRGADMMRRAADSGHIAAANNYGAMLHAGRGVRQDLVAARAYYNQAANAGLPTGLFNLGFMCFHGLGGPVDHRRARFLFLRAAQQDETDAIAYLGLMLMSGQGGDADPSAARNWWSRGASLGNSRCAFNLGIAHAGGHGSPQDLVKAWRWFRQAERLGNEGATKELRRLERAMSAEEQDRAFRRAS